MIKTNNDLTAERLREVLSYNFITGEFRWSVSPARSVKVGCVAGCVDKVGYRVIRVDNVIYKAHRLAFLYMEGVFPKTQVDHVNREKSCNAWINIRDVTRRVNNENKSNNTSFIGVSWHRWDSMWSVYSPNVKGVRKNLGSFTTHLAACYARWWYDINH